jgi:hypothetical protein
MRTLIVFLATAWFASTVASAQVGTVKPVEELNLSTGKRLSSAAGNSYQPTNSFPIAFAVSPDHRYAALLNNGYGSYAAEGRQSIAIIDLETGTVTDFPDDRLGPRAHQTYFLGIAFSSDGKFLSASFA